jgi:hypothetical protein
VTERRALKQAGSRTAFVVGDGAVGMIDGGEVRFARSAAGWVTDVALGAGGPLVIAAENTEGGRREADLLRLSPDGATGFGRPVLLAGGGERVDGSLAVGASPSRTVTNASGGSACSPWAVRARCGQSG